LVKARREETAAAVDGVVVAAVPVPVLEPVLIPVPEEETLPETEETLPETGVEEVTGSELAVEVNPMVFVPVADAVTEVELEIIAPIENTVVLAIISLMFPMATASIR